ncbi:MAG: CDGSH iron-sulfur domain-containing protein [Anaerolineae bacterium]
MKEKIFEYECEAITIIYDVVRCTHFEACVRGLPSVFSTQTKPWVTPEGGHPDEVAEVILRCPTGALHFKRHDGGPEETIPEKNLVEVRSDGPLFLHGDVEILTHGREVLLKDTRIALCRCGASQNKPLCDNTHLDSGFEEEGKLPLNCGNSEPVEDPKQTLRVLLAPNGPLILRGAFELHGSDEQVAYFDERTALCRCGATKNPPFCDGTHAKIGFETE